MIKNEFFLSHQEDGINTTKKDNVNQNAAFITGANYMQKNIWSVNIKLEIITMNYIKEQAILVLMWASNIY